MTATVDGTHAYLVRLEVTRTGLRGRCSCPYGSEVPFCKHCVAVALAWLDDGGRVGGTRPEPVSDERLRAFLLGCDPAWLVDQLMAAAATDELLRARLDVAAGAEAEKAYDDRKLRARLEQAIEIGDYIDYGEAYSYFHYVGEALDAVAELVDGGFPDAAITLAEYALELLEGAAERVDDSDGGLQEAIDHAEEIHLAACAAGSPDPIALAERLVARALNSEYEVFLTVMPDYEEVLGPAGMARYRELVEQAWNKLPPKKPHDYNSRRFTATYLMERLAESAGVDAFIEVLASDVTSGYDVLRIAEVLCADGRDDEAPTWLERGMTEFEPDQRVRSLAADCHLRAGRRDRAGELLWANFAERPDLDGYRALRDATAEDFPAWRERALTLLESQPQGQNPWLLGRRSVLVEILLWEGDTDAAWQAAVKGGCSAQLWLRVARARATTHPADAIPVLLRAADQAIDHKNRNSYRTAARLLTEAKPLFARCGRDQDFLDHLAALRTTHRAKRALREELDREGLP